MNWLTIPAVFSAHFTEGEMLIVITPPPPPPSSHLQSISSTSSLRPCMCVTVIKLITTFPKQVRDIGTFLTSRCCSLKFTYRRMILIKVTNLSEGFVMVGRRQWDPLGDVLSLVSFYVIHRLFSVAPESSNISFVSGLSVHLYLFSARSLLVFSATVW